MEIFLITSFNHLKLSNKGCIGKKTLGLVKTDNVCLSIPEPLTSFFLPSNSSTAVVGGNNVLINRTKFQMYDFIKATVDLLVTRGKLPGRITVYVHLKSGDQKIGLSFNNIADSWDFLGLTTLLSTKQESIKKYIEKITAYENLPDVANPEDEDSRAGVMIQISRNSICFFEGFVVREFPDVPEKDLDFLTSGEHQRINFKFEVTRMIPGITYLVNNYAGLLFRQDLTDAEEVVANIKVVRRSETAPKNLLISHLRTEIDCLFSFKRLLANPKSQPGEHSATLENIAIQNLKWLEDNLITEINQYVEEYLAELEGTALVKAKKTVVFWKEVLVYLKTPVLPPADADTKPLKVPVGPAEHSKMEPVYQLIAQAVQKKASKWDQRVLQYSEMTNNWTQAGYLSYTGFCWNLDRYLFDCHQIIVKATLDLFWPEKKSYNIGQKKVVPRTVMTYQGPKVLTRRGYKLEKDCLAELELSRIRSRLGANKYLKLTSKALYSVNDTPGQSKTEKLFDVQSSESVQVFMHPNYRDVVLTCGPERSLLAVDLKNDGMAVSKKYGVSGGGVLSAQGCLLAVFHDSPGLSFYRLSSITKDSDVAKRQESLPSAAILQIDHRMLLGYFFKEPFTEIGGYYQYASHAGYATLLNENLVLVSFHRLPTSEVKFAAATGLFEIKQQGQLSLKKLGDLIEENPVNFNESTKKKSIKWTRFITKIVGRNTLSLKIVALENLILYRVIQVVHNDTLRLVRPWTEFPASTMKKLLPMINNSPTLDHDITHPAGILLTCSTVGGAQKEQALHVFRFRLDV